MNIAYLITDLDVGGAEQNLEALARTLAGRGHRVRVASLMPPGAVGERLAGAGIPVADLHKHYAHSSTTELLKDLVV